MPKARGDPQKRGRKPLYEEMKIYEKLDLIEAWARDGDTEETIYTKLGVGHCTFNDWKKKYLEFSEALKNGKEVIDIKVENALLKRALGYRYEEIKIETEYGVEKKVTRTIKDVPPDTTAQIYWLKNRRPKLWNNRTEPEKEDEITKVIFEEDKDE